MVGGGSSERNHNYAFYRSVENCAKEVHGFEGVTNREIMSRGNKIIHNKKSYNDSTVNKNRNLSYICFKLDYCGTGCKKCANYNIRHIYNSNYLFGNSCNGN